MATLSNFRTNFRNGVDKVRDNPQLTYTILVAVVIVGAFAFMAERFTGIASNAQDRLVNIRIGSLQDAFVSFATDKVDDGLYLNSKINEIISNNETIKSFQIIKKETVENGAPVYRVIASNNVDEVGQERPEAEFLYTLATSDPNNSITLETNERGERFFKTARAMIDSGGGISHVVMTVQTLSLADQIIEKDIQNSVIILVGVLLILMLLFLRHSKIIDYMNLYKKLKEVDELKDDFISMASHELRTPLTIIRGYAEFIREAPEKDPTLQDYASKIDSSAKDLDSLIGDILDVSRIEQGRLNFKMEKLNPVSVLEDATSSFSLPAKDKGLSIELDKSGIKEGDFIMVDKDRLRQILVNIVGNAVKYTLKGEIKLRAYTEGKSLLIRVSDSGVGMSAEEREHLFEKFYRIRSKETMDVRGTGLGLWISKKMVEEMGGKISVESIKGVGSYFILRFPLVS